MKFCGQQELPALLGGTGSLTAAEKQAVLDAGIDGDVASVLVNRSVTVRLGTTHLLCTGVGDFSLDRRLLTKVADALQLPKRTMKDCRINPSHYAPERELGLLTGMVSPFVSPAVSRQRLQAVVLLDPHVNEADQQTVAISLSPFESMLVPLTKFRSIVQLYAQRAHADIVWTSIGHDAA